MKVENSVTPAMLRALLLAAMAGTFVGCGQDEEPDGANESSEGDWKATDRSGELIAAPCTDPISVPEGDDVGLYRCQEGYWWRAETKSCPLRLPRDQVAEIPEHLLVSVEGAQGGAGGASNVLVLDECMTDADCGDKGRCEVTEDLWQNCLIGNGLGGPARQCLPGCTEDSDCESGQMCRCDGLAGQCTAMASDECRDDSDCEGEARCLQAKNGFLSSGYYCQTAQDTCLEDSDCGDQECVFSEGRRSCAERQLASCGRPFPVDEALRQAPFVRDTNWAQSGEALLASLS